MKCVVRALLVFMAPYALAQNAGSGDPLAGMTQADVASGKRVFNGQCAPCHGIGGTGGRGASLAQARLRHAPDNQALLDVIQHGIPNSGMPPGWQLTSHEAQQVAAYVRSLGQIAAAPSTGSAARGREVFAKSSCSSCHIIRGEGGSLGPELTEVGSRRSPSYLAEKLVKPGAALPERFLLVRAVRRDGREATGIRLNEDSFTIQLKDASGAFLSFRKGELTRLDKLFGQTLMPSYASLTPEERDDLVAFLASLRGEP